MTVSDSESRDASAPTDGARQPDVLLSTLAHGRDNNFNLIRAVLAAMVLVHHAFELTGRSLADYGVIGRYVPNLGEWGVNGFFFVSGLLVTRSLLARRDLVAFVAARCLRIYPGLWVMLVVTTFGLAGLSSLSLVDYLTDPQTWRYFFSNATAFFINFDLPGLFRANPLAAANGSLWSLKYELLCYAGLVVSGLLGLAQLRWPFLVATAFCIVLYLFDAADLHYFVELLRRLGLMFGLGACAAAFADRIPVRFAGVVVLCILAAAMSFTLLGKVFWGVAFAYFLLWFAYRPKGAIQEFNRLPDVSYGLYIYAFPVQQALIATGIAIAPFANILLTTVIVTTLATTSWYAVEKPALALKDHFGRRRDPRLAT